MNRPNKTGPYTGVYGTGLKNSAETDKCADGGAVEVQYNGE